MGAYNQKIYTCYFYMADNTADQHLAPISGTPTHFGMWIYGNNHKAGIRLGVLDAQGQPTLCTCSTEITQLWRMEVG